ncbi:MAG: DUF4364 family protein [Eubacterium sp.]|nr:DUF4364 family protein [Eubacterium sp.]
MIDSSLSLYKLIILYLLKQVSFPLTVSQISDCVVGLNYMTYFRMNEVLQDLGETGLANAEYDQHMTHYTITQDGLESLYYLDQDLSGEIKEEIQEWLRDHS